MQNPSASIGGDDKAIDDYCDAMRDVKLMNRYDLPPSYDDLIAPPIQQTVSTQPVKSVRPRDRRIEMLELGVSLSQHAKSEFDKSNLNSSMDLYNKSIRCLRDGVSAINDDDIMRRVFAKIDECEDMTARIREILRSRQRR